MYLDDYGRKWFKGNLHTHTTVSDGSRSPDEVAATYRAAGFDFLAFTDHWNPSKTSMQDGLLLLPGCEYDVGTSVVDGIYHIISMGAQHPEKIIRSSSLTPQNILDAIHEASGYAILAHPSWSLNQPAEILKLHGVDASEVFNSVSNVPWNGCRADSSVILDTVAALGMPLPMVASDDSHFYTGEECTNFIWLQADELNFDAIMDALKKGRFYASQGPKMAVEWDGSTMKVHCSPAKYVVFYTNMVYSAKRVAKGPGITQAEYQPGAQETFLRAEVIDEQGRKAWASPVILNL